MASYGNGTSSHGAAPSTRPFLPSKRRHDQFASDDSSLLDDCITGVRKWWRSLLRFWDTKGKKGMGALLWLSAQQVRKNLALYRLVSFPHVLVAVWMLVLLWGERWVFHTAVESCSWDNWENWGPGVTPHHLIFVADPQLIDPHSYPGRPWPISSLTYTITDNYMRRSYHQLQSQLHPDTIFFLGDLFDGGREWQTYHGNFDDPGWLPRPKDELRHVKKWRQKYGESFWLQEYLRFNELFINPWNLPGAKAGPGQRGRKLITSLPGNHDFGFGSGVKVPARDRFEAFFGDVNRVDVIANHTFVSIDSLSLSARSSEQASISDLSSIYQPTEEFLGSVQSAKRKAVERELRYLRGDSLDVQQRHEIQEVGLSGYQQISRDDLPTLDPGEGKAELPTILLTHVPLFRPPGTPCGPKREHWPQANPPVDIDHRNAISVSRGYQYQNVLSEADSVDLVQKVGNVVHAFSGDDHDYCELTHGANEGNVKEITVKSISMAMGVPTPGFVMMSMYNPIDSEGRPLSRDPSQTLQTHLCLLPTQLATYARYGGFAFVCFVMLAIRAFLVPIFGLQPFALDPQEKRPILPVFKAKRDDHDMHASLPDHGSSVSSYNSSPYRSKTRDRSASASLAPGLKASGLISQARNAPLKSGGNTRGLGRHSSNREKGRGKWGWGEGQGPKIEIDLGEDDVYYYDSGKARWKASASRRRGGGGKSSNLRIMGRELWTTAWRTLWMVACYWAYLTWKG
ncbi:putative frost protein [Coniella lustricola]|uniref:Putative frost protein n=1 Tax=Coniella lustricola TaxID=2025994 RepID=A0A2T3AA02_9PEZI|nr:putative frost protein [Coniella lustricola]